ncbi:MAG: hypothetical protein HOY79_12830 [Streptomyces sp.]|nr:hypothetical protein [Streptomyces sp.]
MWPPWRAPRSSAPTAPAPTSSSSRPATAVPTLLEAQLRYVTTALTHLRTSGAYALDVKPEAEAAHQQSLHDALRTTVYNAAGGTSYYFGLPGINTFCWPRSTARLVKRLHAFDPDAHTWAVPLPGQADAERDGLPARPCARPSRRRAS